ncbi:MAG: head GIN domain-containing protein [Bacteroidota bacterium]
MSAIKPFLLYAFCFLALTTTALAQVTKNYDVSTITGISIGLHAEVEITQSNQQSITVTTSQRNFDRIKTRVKGGNWEIKTKDGANIGKDVKIKISLKNLEEINLAGSAKIVSTNTFKNLEDLEINISGSGSIDLSAEGEEVDCNIAGSGSLYLKGSAEDMDVSIAGSGNIDAYDFKVEKCDVSSAGSGNVKVHVDDQLNASMVGSGDVYYKGSPKVQSSIIGSGDLEKAGS